MGSGLDLCGLRKTGDEFPVEISLSPLKTETGMLVCSSIRDVTDRKRVELALHDKSVELQKAVQAKERAEQLEHEIRERKQVELTLRQERDLSQRYLDTAEVILLALDPDGLITLINRKGCDLLGWTERELLGRDWIETCLSARMRRAFRGALADRRGPNPPRRARRTGARRGYFPGRHRAQACRDRAQRLNYEAQLQTERKRAEAELTRHNDEIQVQRLRVFKATMTTVQDVVNNLLNGLQLVHLEAEHQAASELQTLVARRFRRQPPN